MKAQFKYALLREMPLRVTALAALILLNLAFGILGYVGVLGEAAMITAVSLSGVALCGIFTINIIADVGAVKSIFGTPDGYLSALTPVKSWKLLLANAVTMICEDIIALFIGIFGVVWQSFLLSGLIGKGANQTYSFYPGIEHSFHMGDFFPDVIYGLLIILLGYAYIIMLIIFGSALKNSVFFGIRGKSWLALLCVAAVIWAFNLFDFVLAPFGSVYNWGIFYNIDISYGFGAGFVVWLLLMFAKIAALFAASSFLLERKNNL